MSGIKLPKGWGRIGIPETGDDTLERVLNGTAAGWGDIGIPETGDDTLVGTGVKCNNYVQEP